jgi:hypothetical protein
MMPCEAGLYYGRKTVRISGLLLYPSICDRMAHRACNYPTLIEVSLELYAFWWMYAEL